MLLSSPDKKVTKECGLRRRALGIFRRNLRGKICFLVPVLHIAAATFSPLCRYAPRLPFGQKIGTFFVRTGCRLRCSSSIANARLGFPRGRLWRAGARHSAPLGRLLLVLFLAKQEKYITPVLHLKKEKPERFPSPVLKFKITSGQPFPSERGSWIPSPGT